MAGSGAAAALCVLGALAALSIRHLVRGFPGWGPLADRAVSMELVLQGVPADQDAAVRSFLERRPGLSPEEAARLLAERFPFYRSVLCERDWLARRVRLRFEPRRAVARARLSGRDAGHLGSDGVVFESPGPWLDADLPTVELGSVPAPEREAVANALSGLRRSPNFRSLRSLSRVSSEEGWEARLGDGTRVLWGDLRWTQEKAARLKEVLEDAGEEGKSLIADLRHFEDGRILVRTAQ